MRMQKRKFRIGELAKKLAVERFVIRFWEKEFELRTARSHGGQRFYDEKDLATFARIKELLYRQGFTIAGARKQLCDKKKDPKTTTIIASQRTTMEPEETKKETSKEYAKYTTIKKDIKQLREKLITLQNLL